jgi:hypothetical protein
MQLLLHLFMVSGFGSACPKDPFSLHEQFLFPVRDLIRMDSKLLGSFSQGAIPSDGGQGHFGLERWGMIPSGAFGHLLLLSLRRNIPQKISLIPDSAVSKITLSKIMS